MIMTGMSDLIDLDLTDITIMPREKWIKLKTDDDRKFLIKVKEVVELEENNG